MSKNGHISDNTSYDERLKTYLELFKISNEGFALTNMKGEILDCNPAFEKITGYSLGELREISIFHITPKKYWDQEKDNIEKKVFKEKTKVNITKEYINKNGHHIPARVTIYPHTNNSNEVTGVWAVVKDISEEIKSEQEIKENREKLRILLDNVPLGIYRSNKNGEILSANQALVSMFGFKSIEELQAFPSIHFYVKTQQRDELLNLLKQQETIKGYRVEFQRKDKSRFWGSVNVKGIFNESEELLYFDGVIDDITEKLNIRKNLEKSEKEVKAALKESEEQNRRLQALLDGAHSILKYNDFEKTARLLFDNLKKVTGATAGYTALLTDDGKENKVLFLDQGGSECNVDPGLPMPVRGLREQVYKTGEAAFHNDFMNSKWAKLMPEGHSVLKNVMFIPLNIQNKTVGLMGLANKKEGFTESDARIGSAFGELAALALHNHHTMDDLIKAKENAELSDKLKTSFLSNMSHEIRTPMNAIIGFSEFLSDPDISENEKLEFIRIIQNNGELLVKIIDDIIDVAKIEAGELNIEEEEVDVNDAMQTIHNNFLLEINKSGKEIDFDLNSLLPDHNVTVRTDIIRLRQVFTNLLSNALKFTEKGKIELGYNINNDRNLISFFVKDTGIGIPKDKIDVIFERFRQGDESKTKIYGGTGIGLTITRSLINLLGGKIWLDSEPNKGSSFYFSLPLHKIENKNDTETASKAKPEAKKPYSWQGKTIMIVEDVESNMELLITMLAGTDAKIVPAQSGEEAFSLALNNEVDLILMDIRMPGIDGYETTRKIKKLYPDIPVIAQTAHAITGEKLKAFKAGCDDYIAKPIKKAILLETITNHFGGYADEKR